MSLYATLLRPLLFRLDPEHAHHLAMGLGARAAFAAPLMRTLSILVEQSEDKKLARALVQVQASVESGSAFSVALGMHLGNGAAERLVHHEGCIEFGRIALFDVGQHEG